MGPGSDYLDRRWACNAAAQASASRTVGSPSASVARIAALKSDSGSRRAARSNCSRVGSEEDSPNSSVRMALAPVLICR